MDIKLVYLGLLVAIAANTIGQILFKISADHMRDQVGGLILAYATNPYIWFAVGFYFAASIVWVWVLQWLPISTAYPLMSLVFILVPLAGIMLFNETQDLRFFIGAALILGGIFLVSM